MNRTTLFSLLLIALCTRAHAASFDCKKAVTHREKTLCADPKLSALDDSVAAAYATLRAHLSPAAADLIRIDQREWLHFLDAACAASPNESGADCLNSEYGERLQQLALLPQPAGVPVLYTRARFILKPASAEDSKDTHHAFGIGHFAWPQIDNPTPLQAAWNQAGFNAALATTSNDNKPAVNLESGVDPEGTIDLSVTILGFNDHLIVASITNSTYGYGAAHPNTSATCFSWLPQAGRPLIASDVFRPDSHWQQALVPVALARLKAAGGLGDPPLFGEAELEKSVATELANPAAWSFTRTAFIVNFGQYEIAPYSSGMPEIRLPWTTLKPYLAPGFSPETLPAPFPKQR